MADKHRVAVGFKHPYSYGAGNDNLFIEPPVDNTPFGNWLDMDGAMIIDMDEIGLVIFDSLPNWEDMDGVSISDMDNINLVNI